MIDGDNSDVDPFEPPIRVKDGAIVAHHGATLPRRCFICNGPPAGLPVRTTFVSSAVDQPHGVITGAIHFATRQTVPVYLTYCARHRALRRLAILSCVFVPIVIVGLTLVRLPSAVLWTAGSVGAALLYVLTIPLRRYTLKPVKMEAPVVWLTGAARAYLAEIEAAAPPEEYPAADEADAARWR